MDEERINYNFNDSRINLILRGWFLIGLEPILEEYESYIFPFKRQEINDKHCSAEKSPSGI